MTLVKEKKKEAPKKRLKEWAQRISDMSKDELIHEAYLIHKKESNLPNMQRRYLLQVLNQRAIISQRARQYIVDQLNRLSAIGKRPPQS